MKRGIKRVSFEVVSIFALGFVSLLFFRSIETSQTKALEVNQEALMVSDKKSEALPVFGNAVPKFSENSQLCKANVINGACLSTCPAPEREKVAAQEIDKKFAAEKRQTDTKVLGAEKIAVVKKAVQKPKTPSIAGVRFSTDPKQVSCKGGDHPSKSKTKGTHTDEDCCIDPDEYLKSGCVYHPKALSIAKKRK